MTRPGSTPASRRARASGWLVAVSVPLACSSSCSPPTPLQAMDDASCPGTTAQAIVGGAVVESYLGLGSDQLRAIVKVVDASDPPDAGGALCSGVFVTPTWVATAGHCLQIGSPVVLVPTPDGSTTALDVVQSVHHPSVDVALLQIGASDAAVDPIPRDGGGAAAPIVVVSPNAVAVAPGDAIEMAGYGLTEESREGVLGTRHFLVETVTAIDGSSITVSGFGLSGACDGDSGGPLLVRDDDGRVAVVAVLSLGSSTCNEDDTYIRLDAIRDWIDGVTRPLAAMQSPCGNLDVAGRCLYGNAVWCAGGVTAGETCPAGSSCGWDPSQSGYRCVASSGNACPGVDAVGVCRGNAAVRCDQGAPMTRTCGCGTCRVDGTTGEPACSGG